jgi:NAD(P)-dependent dehydrogenase (short-subunit alcohol dehydrogenase family)
LGGPWRALSAAGAAVAVCARTSSQLAETVGLIERQGGRALAVLADMADRRAVEAMVEQVEGTLGPVDVLVNNAGILGPAGPFAKIDLDAWWEVQVINLRGARARCYQGCSGVDVAGSSMSPVTQGSPPCPWAQRTQ